MYLSVNQDGTFSFKSPENNQILDTDILISDDIYDQFFQQQAQGKQFKIGNAHGTTFTDIFVEYTPVIVPHPPSVDDRLSAIESAISYFMEV
jgi:hypothetical protein